MALNPQQHSIILNEIKKSLGKKDNDELSRYEMAKGALAGEKNGDLYKYGHNFHCSYPFGDQPADQ